MKLFAVLLLAGLTCAAVHPKPTILQAEQERVQALDNVLEQSHPVEGRNWLIDQAVNVVVNQAINYIRRIINGGSEIFNIPQLDPLSLDHFHLEIPAGLINLDLELEDVYATGFGGFVTQRGTLNIRTLILQLDIMVPQIDIRAKYDLTGDLFTAIPLYGKGDAVFVIDSFNFRANVQLKQSDDGQSVVIDTINDIFFEIPTFHSHLSGVIGGGDIDAIVNAIVEDVIIGYVNRFHGAIGLVAGHLITIGLNPILEQLDTWRFLAPFV